MILKILTSSGSEHEVDTEPTDTILDVKEKLERLEGISVQQQRLVYQGKKLDDDRTLDSYRSTGGATMQLIVALRGG